MQIAIFSQITYHIKSWKDENIIPSVGTSVSFEDHRKLDFSPSIFSST